MSLCDGCRGAHILGSANKRRSSLNQEPLRRFVATNIPPTESVSLDIRNNILPSIDADLNEIKAKLAELQKASAALVKEQESLLAMRVSHAKLLSPLRHIPSEILTEILLYIMRMIGFDALCREHRSLAAVCSKWRSVILGNPSLWSHIHLPLSAWTSQRSYHNLDLVLARSGSLGVNLTVDIDWSVPTEAITHICPVRQEMLWRIGEEVARWKVVDLRLPDPKLILSGMESVPVALESLSLAFPPDAKSSESKMFRKCLKLRRLHITLGSCPIKLPWAQIDDLSICGSTSQSPVDMDKYVNLIEKCTALRRLEAEIPLNYFMDQPLQLKTCPTIKYLRSDFAYLLNFLVMPALQEAHISSPINHWQVNDILPPLVNLMTRSKCFSSLTHLTFCYDKATYSPSSQHLLYILHRTINLETLSYTTGDVRSTLRPADVGYSTDAAALADALSTPILPRLRRFSLHVPKHDNHRTLPYFGRTGSLAEALQQRRTLETFEIVVRAAKLRSSVLRQAGDMEYVDILSQAEIDDLETLRGQGLKLHLSVSARVVSAKRGVVAFESRLLVGSKAEVEA